MRRIVCMLAVVAVLSGSAGAYNGDAVVYVTDSGSKYHQEWCSYLKSANILSLEEAVAWGYTPCSRCGPPILSGGLVRIPDGGAAPQPSFHTEDPGISYSGGGLTLTPIPEEIRTERMLREKELDEAQRRAADAEAELEEAREDLRAAEGKAEEAEKKLADLEACLFISGVVLVFVVGPYAVAMFNDWRWRERKRIELAVRAGIEAEAPPPAPEQTALPVSSPVLVREAAPPVKQTYDLSEDNPYLREVYRGLFEGESIADLAGMPKGSGVWFDSDGYPHTKKQMRGDKFTVYITEKGKSYHTAACSSGKRGRAVNICFAKSKGLGPCERCKPMDKLPEWVTEYQRILRICKAFKIDVEP